MFLAIDLGNTQASFGLFDRERLVADFSLSSRNPRTADEWGAAIHGLCALRGVAPADVKSSALCSVVPHLSGPVLEAVTEIFSLQPLQIGPGVRTGMPILYDPPQDVGADRIVNAVAAYSRSAGAAIVVDFGTATTFDAITERGEYLGGVIAPGLQIGAEALFARAARLPRVEISRPPTVIGRSTVHSIQSGLYHGYASLVNGMLTPMRLELGGRAKVYATGGLAGTLADALEGIDAVLPHLTLEGLRLIHQKNRP
jgi:type III pantothenate kinase